MLYNLCLMIYDLYSMLYILSALSTLDSAGPTRPPVASPSAVSRGLPWQPPDQEQSPTLHRFVTCSTNCFWAWAWVSQTGVCF